MKLSKFDFALLTAPVLFFAFGFLLNALVIAANHGQMPVLIPGLIHGACPIDGEDSDVIHTCMNAGTHLKILADWITIRHIGIASPGDFFLWAGDAAFWPALTAFVARVTKN